MAVAGYDTALTLLHPNPNPNPNPKPKRKPKPNSNQVRHGAHPLRCDARWPSRRALPRAPAGRLHLDDRPRLHLVCRVQRGRQGTRTRLLERCCPRVHDRLGARSAGHRRLHLPYTQLHHPLYIPCISPVSRTKQVAAAAWSADEAAAAAAAAAAATAAADDDDADAASASQARAEGPACEPTSGPPVLTQAAAVDRGERVYAVDCNADASRLVVGGRDKRVAMFDTERHLGGAHSGAARTEAPPMLWEVLSEDFVYCCSLSADFQYCACLGLGLGLGLELGLGLGSGLGLGLGLG